jgi:magnesium-transporting ATPase (P-type)
MIVGDFLQVDESALTGESLQVDKKVPNVAHRPAFVR